jgi:DNA-binding transcriptional regulator/RsmH inhibitor MraZ
MILPEFLRTIDPKGRVSLPACIAPAFGSYAHVTLSRTGGVLIEPALRGRPVTRCHREAATRRVTVPKEFRALTRLLPGAEAGLARTANGLLVWAVKS